MGAILLGLLSALSSAQAPVPFISQPLLPDATAPGGPSFTLTVSGTGFASNSVVQWNGSARTTHFVSDSQLTATIPATDIGTSSTARVTVFNPAPGGGMSNLAFFTATANVADAVGFILASSPAVGRVPESVAIGDFNGDGNLDLAAANFSSNTVSVLLGDGSGHFALASSPAVGRSPYSVAVGDFNGDGKPDLVTADSWGGTISVLLGDGTGQFTLASSMNVGSFPWAVAVADFNKDGKLDLVTANDFSGNLSILLGDGTGHFIRASFPVVPSPSAVAVGDLNGDGRLDIAAPDANDGSVYILLGDGAGNFTLGSSPATGYYPSSVAVGDINGDHKLDLAIANEYDGTISVLLGDGTGKFTLKSTAAAGASPFAVAVGDFNGDNNLDLAVANGVIDGTVSILLGDGTGNFHLASSPAAGEIPYSVAVGDFNGDGKMDFAVNNALSAGTVSVLLGTPAGPAVTLSPPSLNFGTELVGTSSAPQNVILTSIGSDTVNLDSIAASTNFSQRNNCGSSLAPGASCTITVKFKPSSPGTQGTVTITDNAPNSPQTVMLTGIGTVVTLSPTSLNFANQTVGTTSAPQTVTLTNHAQRALNISGDGISGTNPGSFAETHTCGRSLAAGASCTISVTFTPSGNGFKTATLGVLDDGGGSPQQVVLAGNGVR
jgi:hypothetical protein